MYCSDFIANFVDEPSVVRDDDDRARVLSECVFERFARVEVEVVGGFVEQ